MVDSDLYHTLDCQLRNETDPAKRLIIGLRMAQEKYDAPAPYKIRQDVIMGRKPRVRVRAVTA